jgi:hypothetical protein
MKARKLTVEEVGPMTGGDLSEPAHGAAQQAYEAAARLDEQAAAELDQAAAHCRVAATHFRGAEMPRGAAHAWACRGISGRQSCGWRNRLAPTASRRASRAVSKITSGR